MARTRYSLFAGLALAACSTLVTAQTVVPTYQEAATGNIKSGIGVTVLSGGGGGGGGAVTGSVANGSPATDAPVLTAGSDGTNVRTMRTDTAGALTTGCTYNSTLPTYTNGNATQCQVGTRGSLNVTLYSADAVAVATISSSADASNNSSNLLYVQSRSALYNGTNWDRVRSATTAADSTGIGLAASVAMAQLDDTSPGTVTENNFGNVRMTANRAILVKQFASDAESWAYAAAASGITNTTTAVTMKTAAGAGVRNYITSCQVDAGTLGAATEVAIRDGASGTVLWRVFSGTGGMSRNATFPTPLRGTANTLLEVVTLTATVTGGVYVNCQGYTAP